MSYGSEKQAYFNAMLNNRDQWVSACGGLEEPFWFNGSRYLCVYNPGRHEHGYYCFDTDVVQEDHPGDT